MNLMNQELTISSGKAQIFGLGASLLGVLLLWTPYQYLWGGSLLDLGKLSSSVWFGWLGVLLVGAIVHECIHALTAVYYGKIQWSQTKFGIQWKSLTPYFHPTVVMPVEKYRVVVMMPLLVMGLFPYALALVLGNGWVLAFGISFTVAAFGDVLILWMMRNLRQGQPVQDHPSKVGLVVPMP